MIDPHNAERIDAAFPAVLEMLRPKAREAVERDGYLSDIKRDGYPVLREVDGWCVFFQNGCALHRIGEERGSKFAYKPYLCALFPLEKIDEDEGNWFIRQKDYRDEKWDLPCLSPEAGTGLAFEKIQDEIVLASWLVQWD